MQSITSFAELHSFGRSIAAADPFGDTISSALRTRLGDWRDSITYPVNAASSIVARSNFYTERGVDFNLADFPEAAFEDTLEITGLRDKRPTLVELYGSPVPPSDSNEEEEAFGRTNMAHDWLQRLETLLRRFIDNLMTKEFGPEWAKHNLPNGIYDNWQDKKSKAEKAGARPRPLIAYADFTHYELIICSRKNWALFAPVFRRPESIRETLQRLYLPRNSTMHAGLITQEDQLLLYAEIKRLTRAFNN